MASWCVATQPIKSTIMMVDVVLGRKFFPGPTPNIPCLRPPSPPKKRRKRGPQADFPHGTTRCSTAREAAESLSLKLSPPTSPTRPRRCPRRPPWVHRSQASAAPISCTCFWTLPTHSQHHHVCGRSGCEDCSSPLTHRAHPQSERPSGGVVLLCVC